MPQAENRAKRMRAPQTLQGPRKMGKASLQYVIRKFQKFK